jgi:hypothetical protein
MARKMRKFSAGGAQGKYDRRMADIKKDFEKDSKGKTGRALEVLTAKRAQRTADAEDDRAKRMGTDRTATRKAEYDAEKNLTRTRKFGADKPAAAAEPAKASAPAAAATPEVAKAKPKTTREEFNEAFRAARNDPAAMKRGNFTFKGTTYTTKMAGEGARRTVTADAPKADTPKVNYRNINFGKPPTTATAAPAATSKPKSPINAGRSPGVLSGASFGELGGYKGRGTVSVQAPQPRQTSSSNNAINDAARAAKLATLKKAAEAPGASGFDKDRYKRAVSSGMYAKGGKVKKENIMKYAKGGSTPPKPSDADRARSKKHLDELKKLKPTAEEGKVAGSANRSEGPGYKKGGKMATKFGAAMKKKSADTKGRAMMKFAKGGSIDGCAVKGKTKTSMVKMKNGGSC